MIALEPDFEEICKAPIVGDVLRREVAVIVDDRLGCGVLMEQPFSGLRLEEKILVDETHVL
jgi:hypothetical protein